MRIPAAPSARRTSPHPAFGSVATLAASSGLGTTRCPSLGTTGGHGGLVHTPVPESAAGESSCGRLGVSTSDPKGALSRGLSPLPTIHSTYLHHYLNINLPTVTADSKG